MSATNAIHGIVVLGGILVIGPAEGFLNKLLCVIAIAFGTINVVGGFLVTDRMLEMFKKRRAEEGRAASDASVASFLTDPDFIRVLYIVAFVLFILGMRQLTGPTTARRGNTTAAVGMAIAVIATLLTPSVGDYGLIVLGIVIGTAVGVPAARNVKMTAMPQMVALFNGVGGGAVALISWAEYRECAGVRRQPGARDADPDPVRGDHRLGLLLGLEHRLREAAGPDPPEADRGSRPAVRQRRGCCWWRSARRWRSPRARSPRACSC